MKNTKLKHGYFIQFCLWVFLVTISLRSYGQDSVRYVPDGTEGEMLEVIDSVPNQSMRKRWRLFPGKITTFKVGAALFYDYAAFALDNNSKRQADSAGYAVQSGFKFRDFRFLLSGQFKTKRTITWKAGIMYDGVSDSWFIRETGVMINVPELWGNIFIGRTKEGFSMNKVMNAASGMTMERQTAIDVIPILADGIKWLGYLPKSRIFWNLGAYGDFFSEGQSFSTYKWQVVSRVGWLPVYSPANKTVLHIAVNYRYGEPVGDQIRLRSRPESNVAPYFIDTQKFSSSGSNHWGGEIYFTKGSWMLGSEFYLHDFNSMGSHVVFSGGEVLGTYIFTGQSRPYYTTSGVAGFVPVPKPVFKGGPGTWELVAKFSTFNLDDGVIHGGKLWKFTPMVNWYLSPELRFEIGYGYAVLDRFNLTGATHMFQTRIQIVL